MTALATQAPPFAAVLIEHRNMEPAIPFGSLVFLAEPGFSGEGIYSLPTDGQHQADVRRIRGHGERWFVGMDDLPGEGYWLTAQQLRDMAPARVVAIVKPLTADFTRYLQSRFESRIGELGL